jgi:hypothetical protein
VADAAAASATSQGGILIAALQARCLTPDDSSAGVTFRRLRILRLDHFDEDQIRTINPTQPRKRRATSRKNDFAKQVIVRKQETHKLVFLYNL